MAYRVELTREADKALGRIARSDPKLHKQLVTAIAALRTDPRPPGCESLTGRDGYRIRVRGCRVLYTIEDRKVLVEVFRVAKRGEVYH
ncbi:type II toxin-antitoxin system RelE/ParE family toxin [Mycobacterium sp. M1]|uniref:Type II toxin-antitoxin system RelE/ParE family toxin n=1 Tax=Mycolicibacter acidiphilus TaxID=2835306 RepID=A0ABS5RKQ3_9MYCO|nr:type II toxin-antitoxin system RelE/ParE family toxin [Mycolicibacter acidiphilus]MBS9534582.1 type II toxin-antitoxin system RelE/ParE family toxin [Mycolicibacter acidiphilus]